jgi:hypothetical protein
MADDTERLLRVARERADARPAPPRPDYARVNQVFARQKAALTRAEHSKSKAQVVAAVRKAVREWGQPPFNGMWPDDWSRWQRALDDILPWNQHVDIQDLAGAERRRPSAHLPSLSLLGRTADRRARRAGRR